MSSINTLTSLSRARSWAGVTTTSDDSTLTSLIAEVSRFIHNYLGRASLFDKAYSDVMDGAGQKAVLLGNWPVTSITQLTVDSALIMQAVNGSGYMLEKWDGASVGMQQRLSLRGYSFSRGIGNVSINYNAGYKIIAEAQALPASGAIQVTVNAPYGNWGADAGVTYSNGAVFVAVAANPVAGQYVVSAGSYLFANADAGANVLISYSYIPSDIEHACVALVAERYRYRSRIGEVSKSLGGVETMTYTQKDMPEFVRSLLQPYKRVL